MLVSEAGRESTAFSLQRSKVWRVTDESLIVDSQSVPAIVRNRSASDVLVITIPSVAQIPQQDAS